MTPIHEPIVARAAVGGSRPAIQHGNRVVDYGDLLGCALTFARSLADLAERPRRIAIEATRTPETVAAILGTLCAGRAYVPLNPNDPLLRQRRIMAGAEVSRVVAAPGSAIAGARGIAAIPGPDFDGPRAPQAVPSDSAPDAEAYVFFTSGSTGAPKGVPLTHRNAGAFVDWAAKTYDIRPDDRIGAYSPLFFDLSTFDLFVGLAAGATVVLVPDDVAKLARATAEYLRDAEVTVLYTVPSALGALLAAAPAPDFLRTLRLLLLAGEPFPAHDLDAIRRAAPRAKLHNLYGPIETNVVTAFALTDAWSVGCPVPIGSPASGATLGILGADGTLVEEPDLEGEIVVHGPSVFAGYLEAADGPSEPFVELAGRRWYRTGDFGTVGADGNLAFRGRKDDRVKTRGFLVELAEVDAVLRRAPGVASAAVVAVGRNTPDAAIHGFVVPVADADEIRPRDVFAWCGRFLPRYMWPAEIHVVGRLPVGRTGKVDRDQLDAFAKRTAT